MKIWVVIPAYNEERGLGALLSLLKDKKLLTLVIDDGSRDKTAAIARVHATTYLHNDTNIGKGISLKKSILYLLAHDTFDYIITMDADSQHSPDDIERFIDTAHQGAKFIVGNRMADPRGMPLIRVWTNKCMSRLISAIIRQKIPDTQCGFRMIHRDVLKKIEIKTDKFQVESEILIKAADAGIRITSIPVRSIYFQQHTSKINPFLDTLRFIWFIFSLKRESHVREETK